MPSRLIISSVKRNTPVNAAAPGRTVDALQTAFDVALHAAAGAPHVDDHPGDRRGGDQRERAVEPFLVEGVKEEVAAERADGDGDADAPVHGGGERARGPTCGGTTD